MANIQDAFSSLSNILNNEKTKKSSSINSEANASMFNEIFGSLLGTKNETETTEDDQAIALNTLQKKTLPKIKAKSLKVTNENSCEKNGESSDSNELIDDLKREIDELLTILNSLGSDPKFADEKMSLNQKLSELYDMLETLMASTA